MEVAGRSGGSVLSFEFPSYDAADGAARAMMSLALMRWPMMGASSYFLLAGQRILARSLKGEMYRFSGKRSPDKRFGQKAIDQLEQKNSCLKYML